MGRVSTKPIRRLSLGFKLKYFLSKRTCILCYNPMRWVWPVAGKTNRLCKPCKKDLANWSGGTCVLCEDCGEIH
jgi:hypothetical protein